MPPPPPPPPPRGARNLGAQENDPTLGLQWLINGQETGEGRGITDIILTIEAYSYENPF